MTLQPNLRTAPAAMPTQYRQLSDGLAWLGGADREILNLARSGRNKFTQMGLVILATASVAVLSMTFALSTGLHLSATQAVWGGFVWGCLIAILDRLLITNLDLRGGVWQVATIVGLRLVIAALLGFVISTPLVLQVFQHEIQAKILLTNAQANTTYGDALNATPIANELSRVRKEIAANEATLRGEIPTVATPDVTARQQYLDEARRTLEELRAISDQKYRAWQCELYGKSCEGSTNIPGNGNLAQAREKEYRDALTQTTVAEKAVADAEAALATARNNGSKLGTGALKTAQDAARAALPGLRKREAVLQAKYNKSVDTGDSTYQSDNGILAQLTALAALGDKNSMARLAHIAIALLFFMIELLPVLVKILSSLGPPSAYERVREMTENSKVDDAKIEERRRTRERDEEEARAAAEAKKRADIEDDMRRRERDLSFKANERVEKEMEGVLDVALTQWAQDVRNTLHTAATNGRNHMGGAPSPSSNSPGMRGNPSSFNQATLNVRSNFNMPNGTNLTSSNGNAP